jgi:hypothetical protein
VTEHAMLELLALDCHRVGSTWAEFWQEHGERVRQAEPYNHARFHRLVQRLLGLLTSGDCDGQQPVGDDLEPWEIDDQANKPDDTKTQARLLANAIPGIIRGCDCPSPCEVCRCS